MTLSRSIFDRLHAMRTVSLNFADAISRSVLGSLDIDFPDTETLVHTTVEVQLPSRVLLYNDDYHTYDEVIFQLMKATGCSLFEAEALVFEVDMRGQAYVFEGEMVRCLGVSSVLEEIELLTEVEFS